MIETVSQREIRRFEWLGHYELELLRKAVEDYTEVLEWQLDGKNGLNRIDAITAEMSALETMREEMDGAMVEIEDEWKEKSGGRRDRDEDEDDHYSHNID